MDDGMPWNTIARGRSREGAWIEICNSAIFLAVPNGRSREGAWIEIWNTYNLA